MSIFTMRKQPNLESDNALFDSDWKDILKNALKKALKNIDKQPVVIFESSFLYSSGIYIWSKPSEYGSENKHTIYYLSGSVFNKKIFKNMISINDLSFIPNVDTNKGYSLKYSEGGGLPNGRTVYVYPQDFNGYHRNEGSKSSNKDHIIKQLSDENQELKLKISSINNKLLISKDYSRLDKEQTNMIKGYKKLNEAFYRPGDDVFNQNKLKGGINAKPRYART